MCRISDMQTEGVDNQAKLDWFQQRVHSYLNDSPEFVSAPLERARKRTGPQQVKLSRQGEPAGPLQFCCFFDVETDGYAVGIDYGDRITIAFRGARSAYVLAVWPPGYLATCLLIWLCGAFRH